MKRVKQPMKHVFMKNERYNVNERNTCVLNERMNERR